MKIILSSCGSAEDAQRVAQQLVEGRFAACVNIVPGIASVYPWKGKIEQATEALLVIKTSDAKAAAARAELSRVHPYETPEIVTVGVEHVSEAYRAWLLDWTG